MTMAEAIAEVSRNVAWAYVTHDPLETLTITGCVILTGTLLGILTISILKWWVINSTPNEDKPE